MQFFASICVGAAGKLFVTNDGAFTAKTTLLSCLICPMVQCGCKTAEFRIDFEGLEFDGVRRPGLSAQFWLLND